nr:hypothetical protein SHINE37_43130 [Rhizobiaceae bacterium]
MRRIWFNPRSPMDRWYARSTNRSVALTVSNIGTPVGGTPGVKPLTLTGTIGLTLSCISAPSVWRGDATVGGTDWSKSVTYYAFRRGNIHKQWSEI